MRSSAELRRITPRDAPGDPMRIPPTGDPRMRIPPTGDPQRTPLMRATQLPPLHIPAYEEPADGLTTPSIRNALDNRAI